jgi:hypothetical protein
MLENNIKTVLEYLNKGGFRMYKLGINYCTTIGRIGFRGVSPENTACLIPIPASPEEIFFDRGVIVPAKMLPYLPDMGEGSDYQKKGSWHHYKIQGAVFIVYFTEPEYDYGIESVLDVILFDGETKPRIFLDQREILRSKGLLMPSDFDRINEILAQNKICLN